MTTMYVLGTAGHVDHGKSVLVRALTGIDPDRLPEEKQRGMTIDLGFAWFQLPSGKEVSIVDVPGHERLLHNMLAGVGGIDLALLVIAADEGVMPQTTEHLAIIDLLNIDRGVVVITKRDLVDEEGLGLAIMEAEEAIRGTTLAQAPIVAVSALTGEGLSELVTVIDTLLDQTAQRRDIGRPRLSIDRIFSMKGFGTVVTGTLIDGRLRIGQRVVVVPPGLETSVRGLEIHKRRADLALPGNRVAVNLGGIAGDQLARGMVITNAGWLKPTRLLAASLRAISPLSRPLTHNMSVTFHTGTAEVGGKVRLLDKERLEAGEIGWAQIASTAPVAAAGGDLFVVRSSKGTLGGGRIVDTHPKRYRRFQTAVIESLKARQGTPEDALLALLETRGACEAKDLAPQSNLPEADAASILESMASTGRAMSVGSSEGRRIFISRNYSEHLVQEATRLLRNYHSSHPLRQGMPREEFRSHLRIQPPHLDGILRRLAQDGGISDEGVTVKLVSHGVTLSPEQRAKADAFLTAIKESPYCPPTDSTLDPEILSMLLEQNKVVRVADGVIFGATAYEDMVRQITEHIRTKGTMTVAEVRDLFQTSRKYAKALMEYLDARKITRRVGDERVLR